MGSGLVAALGTAGDEAVMGGKGARLCALARHGAVVPPGFVVTAEAFRGFMDGAGLWPVVRGAIAGLGADDDAGLAAAAGRIAAAVTAAPMPAPLAAAIDEAYDRLCLTTGMLNLRVAVRSSAIGEDARDASFAGQFESWLGIAGRDAVRAHVALVWVSLFGARALAYRLRQGRDVAETPMAVVVLELVEARSAGVAFSLDPLSGRCDRVVIEGNWGWGEAVVQGVVTPDRAEVDKADLRILSQRVAHKTVVSVFDAAAGRVVEQPCPPLFRDAPVLSDEETVAIARAVLAVETAEGGPVDVEWVIPRGRRAGEPPVLVQVRPVTAAEAETAAPVWNPLAYASK
ncbi:MAG: PEP/pyruvate-binding domain-containing protein, partial [Gemmobacter sp.]